MDTLTGMRTFAAVVDTGSFTQAAERLGISKALTSKYVGQLESHLGVRLLQRTTRRLRVTEVGQAYYQRCRQLLDDLDELEAAARSEQATPQGRLRIAAPVLLGEGHLTRMVAAYLHEQPEVTVELVLADRYVDLIDEGFDLALRIGRLADSSLIARRLSPMHVVLCAAPEYLARAGTPTELVELAKHTCVIDTNIQDAEQWVLQRDGAEEAERVRVRGRFGANSAQAVREMLVAGGGIGLCPRYVVNADLRDGRLVQLLPDYRAQEYGIYVLYPHNRHLAAKVRSFVNFLLERFGGVGGW